MSGIQRSIAELVGETPLMELTGYEKRHGLSARLLAKLEYFNPSGSIKDRAALRMIESAERDGTLRPGDTIVEQTSGNTGIGLAALAVPRGYRLEIFLERGASSERRLMLEAYGARLLDYRDALGRPAAGERGEAERDATLKEIYSYCRRQGPRYHFLDQTANPHNPEAHRLTTGPEIWRDTGGAVDLLVCMMGTGGTAAGLSAYFREKNPRVRIALAQPDENSRLTPAHPDAEIIGGVLPFDGVPEEDLTDFMRGRFYDECLNVGTKEAFSAARELVRTDGLFVGTSSAAALCAAAKLAVRAENAGKNIVVIMPDSGMKYLSTPMFRE